MMKDYAGNAITGYVGDIINASDTRKVINRELDVLENKTVARPWRKYSNINL